MKKEIDVPIVTLEGPQITEIEVKRTLVREITTAAAKAYGFPEEKIVVLVNENDPRNVAVGGVLVADR